MEIFTEELFRKFLEKKIFLDSVPFGNLCKKCIEYLQRAKSRTVFYVIFTQIYVIFTQILCTLCLRE